MTNETLRDLHIAFQPLLHFRKDRHFKRIQIDYDNIS